MNITRPLGWKRKIDGQVGLPPEIWLQIIGYLDEAEAIAASQVCRLWREWVLDDDQVRTQVRLLGEIGEEVMEKRLRQQEERKRERKRKRMNGCEDISLACCWVAICPVSLPCCLCFTCCACFQWKTAPLGEFSDFAAYVCIDNKEGGK